MAEATTSSPAQAIGHGALYILRWIAFIPGAFVGGAVARFLILSGHRIDSEDGILSAILGFDPIFDVLSVVIGGIATVLIGAWIAPSITKLGPATAVATLICLASSIGMLGFGIDHEWWPFTVCLILAVTAVGTTVAIAKGEAEDPESTFR